jgi:hypothetical protein
MNMLQVIQRAVERQGLSDEQQADERKAQNLVLPAVAALRSACQDALLLSDVMRDQLQGLLDALYDYAPTERQWTEAVQEADQ